MTKVKASTLDNLFDVETSTAMQDILVIKVNHHVMQRFVMAYQAGRPVNLVKAAKHEVVSVPIPIFNTNRSIHQSQKSPLVKSILKSAKVLRQLIFQKQLKQIYNMSLVAWFTFIL